MAKTPTVVFDDDNPEWTEEMFAQASGPEGLSAAELAAFPKTRVRGPGRKPSKQGVYIRLSPMVLDYFKAGGEGWQTRIDETLKATVSSARAGKQRRAPTKRRA